MTPAIVCRFRTELLLAAGLGALTLLVFLHACLNGFVNFDDDTYVFANPHVLGGLTSENVAWAFTTGRAYNWHPLTWLSLQLDATLFGAGPAGFHLTNVLLHAANTVLLFAALRALTGAVWRSAVAAAFFGLHPLHVEPVAWVSERKGVLSTLFWMLALLAYAAYVRRPGWRRFLPVVVCLGLGLLAKPMLVTLPCVLLLLDYWPLHRLAGPAPPAGAATPSAATAPVWEKVPLFVLVLVFCGITMDAQAAARVPFDVIPVSVRVWNAASAAGQYLVKTAWPYHLAAHYLHPVHALPPGRGFVSALALGALSWLAWRRRRTEPYLLVGWLWYLGTLVPVSGLVQIGSFAMADRYTYVPLVGVFLALSWAVADLARAYRVPVPAAAAVTGVLLGWCAVVSWVQVTYWQDSRTLWLHNLEVEPHNIEALNNLGTALLNAGEPQEAERYFREALRVRPQFDLAQANLGAALARLGRWDEAESHLRRATELNPWNPNALLNLGLALVRLHRTDEAITAFTAAARLAPESALIRNSLGTALADRGRWEEAVPHLQAALRLDPRLPSAHLLLGQVALRAGRPEEAEAHARAALALSPEFPQARQLLQEVRDRAEGRAPSRGSPP